MVMAAVVAAGREDIATDVSVGFCVVCGHLSKNAVSCSVWRRWQVLVIRCVGILHLHDASIAASTRGHKWKRDFNRKG